MMCWVMWQEQIIPKSQYPPEIHFVTDQSPPKCRSPSRGRSSPLQTQNPRLRPPCALLPTRDSESWALASDCCYFSHLIGKSHNHALLPQARGCSCPVGPEWRTDIGESCQCLSVCTVQVVQTKPEWAVALNSSSIYTIAWCGEVNHREKSAREQMPPKAADLEVGV